jgi:hypothetical protein
VRSTDNKTQNGSNSLKGKIRVPQKSLETIMAENNKKILNDILYQRVAKQMNSTKGFMDLDQKTKNLSNDTIGNFKNLQSTMSGNPRVIEFEDLYQKLNADKSLPKKMFDFTEEQKAIQDSENNFGMIETNLKNEFESIIADIQQKKELVSTLRLTVHGNMSRVKQIQLEVILIKPLNPRLKNSRENLKSWRLR